MSLQSSAKLREKRKRSQDREEEKKKADRFQDEDSVDVVASLQK